MVAGEENAAIFGADVLQLSGGETRAAFRALKMSNVRHAESVAAGRLSIVPMM